MFSILSELLLYLAKRVLNSVDAALDLVVDARYFPLQDITVRLLARVADLLVAVRARIDVRLLRADGAPRHDGVRIRIRQLP